MDQQFVTLIFKITTFGFTEVILQVKISKGEVLDNVVLKIDQSWTSKLIL